MGTLLIAWLTTAFSLGVATLIIPGINAKNVLAFIFASTVLSLINILVRPVLWILTAPLSVLTFGLFAFVINALMIKLTAALVPNFTVKNFGSAFLAALIMAVIGLLSFIAVALITGADVSWTSYEYQSQTFAP